MSNDSTITNDNTDNTLTNDADSGRAHDRDQREAEVEENAAAGKPQPNDREKDDRDAPVIKRKEKNFQAHWLKIYEWLRFDGKVMWCHLCRDAKKNKLYGSRSGQKLQI